MKIIFVVAFAALALSACSSAAPSASTALEITIEATEFGYKPAAVEVGVGRPIRLSLKNLGAVEHDWSIAQIAVANQKEQSTGSHDMHGGTTKPQLHVNTAVGKSAVLEFTPTQPGTYEVICTVAGHKEAGMVGKLIVK